MGHQEVQRRPGQDLDLPEREVVAAEFVQRAAEVSEPFFLTAILDSEDSRPCLSPG